jgi:hypothetical protein
MAMRFTLNYVYWFVSGEIKDVPIILFVPLLTPCTENEKLCITVDLMKGLFLVSLAHKGLYIAVIITVCIIAGQLLGVVDCIRRRRLQRRRRPSVRLFPRPPGHTGQSCSSDNSADDTQS